VGDVDYCPICGRKYFSGGRLDSPYQHRCSGNDAPERSTRKTKRDEVDETDFDDEMDEP
jgi:hypothetical protein